MGQWKAVNSLRAEAAKINSQSELTTFSASSNTTQASRTECHRGRKMPAALVTFVPLLPASGVQSRERLHLAPGGKTMPETTHTPATRAPEEIQSVEETACCIVGGGPAGAVLSLLLARQGIAVTLLELHNDFDRDFRGDTIHPSVMEVLDQLGLADRLLQL